MLRYRVNPSTSEWKQDGVYFLVESDWLQQIIEHALRQAA